MLYNSFSFTGSVDQLKKKPFSIKEGIQYKIRIDFYVQREIVTGLKYVQKIHRHGLQVEKMSQMIGSYPPKTELHSFTTPAEEVRPCRTKFIFINSLLTAKY